MARPRTDLLARIEAKTDKVTRDPHHLWLGNMRRGRPHLADFGNPVRALLQIDHHRIAVKPDCAVKNCINPYHWHVLIEKSHKYGTTAEPVYWTDPRAIPSGLTQMQEEMVAEEVAAIQRGEITLEETLEFTSDPAIAAAIKRQL